MMKRIADWFVYALALVVVSRVVSGIHIQSYSSALIAVVIMSLINILIKPLITILTLPITLLTLGLFRFIINAIMFMIAGNLTPGFSIDSFTSAFIGSIVLTLITSFFHFLLRK